MSEVSIKKQKWKLEDVSQLIIRLAKLTYAEIRAYSHVHQNLRLLLQSKCCCNLELNDPCWKFPHCTVFVILFLLFCWVSTVADQNSPHDGSDEGKHNLSKTSSEMLTHPSSWCPSWKFKVNTPFFSTTKSSYPRFLQHFPTIQMPMVGALPGRCWESTPSRFRVWSPWSNGEVGRWRMITIHEGEQGFEDLRIKVATPL